jgi:hypothetical protein
MHPTPPGLRFIALALLCGCAGEPTIQPIDSGINSNADLINAAQEVQLRIGHFIAGLAPFDVCAKAQGESTYRGPLVRQQAMRAGGVPYANVSAYVTLPVGSYSVRAVPGNAMNCDTPLGGFPDFSLSPLSAGRRYTVVAAGQTVKVPNKASLTVIEDDLSTQGGQVRLRFINASADILSADYGTGSGGTYKALFTDATFGSFGRAASGGGAYVTTGPQSNATFSVRETTAATDLVTVTNKVSVPVGTVATSFLIGLRGNTAVPLELVLCDDTKPAQDGLAACIELLPP